MLLQEQHGGRLPHRHSADDVLRQRYDRVKNDPTVASLVADIEARAYASVEPSARAQDICTQEANKHVYNDSVVAAATDMVPFLHFTSMSQAPTPLRAPASNPPHAEHPQLAQCEHDCPHCSYFESIQLASRS